MFMDPIDEIVPANPNNRKMQPKKQKLEEKDFIQEVKGKNPMPVWLFVAIVVAIFSVLWVAGNWYFQKIETKIQESPFLQVTNREMSLFLWQNPEYMRIHSPSKTGYLPGFNSVGSVNPKLEALETYVSVSPEVLFKYHTWNRLLGKYVIPRPINPKEFREFLVSAPEWDPKNWPNAPQEYRQLISELDLMQVPNMQTLTETAFPNSVRNAFLGWKNYYREGDLINQIKPKVKEMKEFIDRYPNFARNYWRNLYPDYQKSLLDASANPEAIISSEEISPFLRVSFYNYSIAAKE
jgi:hypothetical protein